MIIEPDGEVIEHYGTKGMKWGVRKEDPTGASSKVSRDAGRDAKEFARAKLFYGEGAGNRRKLIKAKVEDKSKRIPGYKESFDHHLKNQDLSKHSDKAVKERKTKDRNTRNKQRVGALARRATGEMGTQAAFIAVAATGAAFLRSPKGRAMMLKTYDKASWKFAEKFEL
jgi:hypothetical protein